MFCKTIRKSLLALAQNHEDVPFSIPDSGVPTVSPCLNSSSLSTLSASNYQKVSILTPFVAQEDDRISRGE